MELEEWQFVSDDGNRIAVGEILNLDHSAYSTMGIGFDAQCVVNVYEWNGGNWIKLGQQLESSYRINQIQHSKLFVNRSISLSGDGTRLGVANYDSYWWGPDNSELTQALYQFMSMTIIQVRI